MDVDVCGTRIMYIAVNTKFLPRVKHFTSVKKKKNKQSSDVESGTMAYTFHSGGVSSLPQQSVLEFAVDVVSLKEMVSRRVLQIRLSV